MFFILPIRTSIRPRRTPYANYFLIFLNVVIFVLTYVGPYRVLTPDGILVKSLRPWADQFMLWPNHLIWYQLVTYAFLHGSYWHIIGNMFFLYLFGNNINDKFGNIGYLGFYLAGAVLSALGHIALHYSSSVPTLGASGAVAAATGAYLVLFPQTLITVFYWFIYFISTMEVPALYFIGFKLIFWDNVLERRITNVAYEAHLAGYAFGILASLLLLATGLVRSSNFDLWAMIKRWNRRRHYRDVISSGYDPFTGRTKAKRIKVKEIEKTPAQMEIEQKIDQLRSDISSRMLQRNLPAAAESYLELAQLDSKQILPRQHLLDIANQLASDKQPAEAAIAYEQFLAHYGNYEYIEQVELMLGILYARYLDKPDLAVKHLQAASTKLTDPGQKQMCDDELAKLQAQQ